MAFPVFYYSELKPCPPYLTKKFILMVPLPLELVLMFERKAAVPNFHVYVPFGSNASKQVASCIPCVTTSDERVNGVLYPLKQGKKKLTLRKREGRVMNTSFYHLKTLLAL